MPDTTSVLIVGGGLNGLTMAALLAQNGVRCIVAERHRGTSIQYKFAGISPRSMEIFRRLGMEAEIRGNRTGDQQGGVIARGRTLADPDISVQGAAWPDASAISPTQPATCDQHVLEPILSRHAARHGADIRFGTEFLHVEQRDEGITATLRDRQSGRDYVVAADYLVAADGAGGTTREMLGIGCSGPGVLQHWMNIIFDTDLPPVVRGERFTSCFVSDLNATFTPRENGRWLLALQYFPERGDAPADFHQARVRELVARGAGRDDVRADLVDARPWDVAARVADRFSAGRAFLIGDAAHLMPPTGAFGGNSGIHDADNLAWKLAMVLRGEAGAGLLDSYDEERRPVIEATLAQALARLQAWFKDPANRLPPPVAIVPDYDVVLGQFYASGAFVAESVERETAYVASARPGGGPGTRAPHVPIRHRGEACSTLDLFGKSFVLLTDDSRWREAARILERRAAVSIECPAFAVDGGTDWREAFGIGARGASLVRPDGIVAWRAAGEAGDPVLSLAEALAVLSIECRAESGCELIL